MWLWTLPAPNYWTIALTQQQVAETLGMPQSFVAKYEGGERRLDVIEFIEAAEALGADPKELFGAIITAMQGGK